MTRSGLLLWTLSLLLQGSLLVLLWARKLVRRVPVFAGLLSFYLLRSAGLLVVSRFAREALSPATLSGLALLDLVLQVAVAWEIVAGSRSEPVRPDLLGRAARFAGLVLLSIALAALLAASVHGSPRFPMDRSILFISWLFVLICGVSVVRGRTGLMRHLAEGFALIGTASLAAQVGRTLAAAGQNALAYRRWSFVEPVLYLAVILFWIAVLPRERARLPSGHREEQGGSEL